jgi:tetratricopeptide (TPR) repeat protein
MHGLTILSNLAELENSNYEGYKMLGYKLKETGEYENALSAFKKVLELRPADPQSYRDCALAYGDLGKYQQALQMLNTGLTKTYIEEMYDMYEGIEEVFLTEINHLVTLHKNKLNLEGIDKKILSSMEMDLRIVMNWNLSNTDIDLWITDPTGEKCYYENTQTKIGARLTDDFTEGFGPEQFMLKKTVKGKYKIEIDFYSDSEVKLPVPVTMMLEVYKYYGTAREEKKIITLQLQRDTGREVFVGEVDFN